MVERALSITRKARLKKWGRKGFIRGTFPIWIPPAGLSVINYASGQLGEKTVKLAKNSYKRYKYQESLIENQYGSLTGNIGE